MQTFIDAMMNYFKAISIPATLDFCVGVFLFLLLILIGGIISKFVGKLIERVLREKLKLDEVMKRHGLGDALGPTSLSYVIGAIMMWLVFLIFITEGLAFLDLDKTSDALVGLVSYIPQVIYAIIIVIIGLIAADWIADRLLKGPSKSQQVIAMIVKPIVIFFAIIIAGEQLGFQLDFLVDTLKWSLIGIVWGIALAIGLGVGLGYGLDKKTVPKMLEKFMKKNVKK